MSTEPIALSLEETIVAVKEASKITLAAQIAKLVAENDDELTDTFIEVAEDYEDNLNAVIARLSLAKSNATIEGVVVDGPSDS